MAQCPSEHIGVTEPASRDGWGHVWVLDKLMVFDALSKGYSSNNFQLPFRGKAG